MHTDDRTGWTPICPLDDILPGTGVCARVNGRHIAVFRIGQDACLAIDNIDPRTGASVLARGIVGNLGARLVVASPLYKEHYDLRTGECVEQPAQAVRVHAVRIAHGRVEVRAT